MSKRGERVKITRSRWKIRVMEGFGRSEYVRRWVGEEMTAGGMNERGGCAYRVRKTYTYTVEENVNEKNGSWLYEYHIKHHKIV